MHVARNRSGLGRGLGALMGEPSSRHNEKPTPEKTQKPVETNKPSNEAAKQEKVSEQSKRSVPLSPDQTVKQASSVKQTDPLAQDVAKKQEHTAAVPSAPVQPSPTALRAEKLARSVEAKEEQEAISGAELEDHVVIKSVKTRPATKQEEEIQPPQSIPIDKVHPNPDQPRSQFKKEELEELADSIKQNGLLQPILVRKTDDGYQIIAGERRWQASKLAGLKEIPIVVLEADDDRVIELAMIENIQRSDLNPIEEAYGYRRLMERKNLTQSQLAQLVSKGRSTIANSLRLLDLPEDAQQLLYEEKITAGHARAILSIPTMEGRVSLTQKLAEKPLSVREAENIARLIAGREKATATPQRPVVPKEYKLAAKSLSKELDTKVRVKIAGGKNKLEIEFTDQAQLEDILERISNQ